MFSDRTLVNRRNVVTDVSKRFDANKKFFILEVHARIVAAFLVILGIKDMEEQPSEKILPQNISSKSVKERKEFFHRLCSRVVDEYVVNADKNGDLMRKQAYSDWLKAVNPKTEDGRFACREVGCSKAFTFDGKARLDHEKSHGLHKVRDAIEKKSGETDAMFNYQRSLLDFGTIVLNFFDAISEGDGARLVRCWKFMLPYLKADGQRSRKYALEALYLIIQIEVLLSRKDAHSLIWNRFHKSIESSGGNIPMDLMIEHNNNFMKNAIRSLGPNCTNKRAVDRIAKAVTVTKKLVDNFDRGCAIYKRSGKHTETSARKDLKKVVDNLMTQNALTHTSGRNYKVFDGMQESLLEDFDLHGIYAWIEQHKKKIMINRANR